MKKKKDQWEEEAKNHLVAELKAQGRGEWRAATVTGSVRAGRQSL